MTKDYLENLQGLTLGDCNVKLIRDYIEARLKEIKLEAKAKTEQETQLTTLQKKHDELRGLVKNMLDEEANDDGFCPLYTPLAKAINWIPVPVNERDVKQEIVKAWAKEGCPTESIAFTLSYLKQHPEALARLQKPA